MCLRLHTISIEAYLFFQKNIYSVTNSLEGGNFVDSSLASTLNVQSFVKSLFPALSDAQAASAAQKYAGLGSNYLQAILIMGEGEHIQSVSHQLYLTD